MLFILWKVLGKMCFSLRKTPFSGLMGILPVSGITEWVINGNKETTEEGLFLIFFYVCLVFSTGEKIVLIKYSGKYIEIYFNLKITYFHFINVITFFCSKQVF